MKTTLLIIIAALFAVKGAAQIQLGNTIYGKQMEELSGYRVSLNSDGSVVAIAAPNNNSTGFKTGCVRIYKKNGTIWEQTGDDIIGEAEYDRFGKTLSLSANGSVVAIGTPDNDGNGTGSGHVRIYQNNNNNWEQIGSDIDGEAKFDEFGNSISLNSDGSIIAIGALNSNAQITVLNPTSIKSVKHNQVSIYPNPTNGVIHISMKNETEAMQHIQVTDINGKLITRLNMQNNLKTDIDLSDYEYGIYILKIQTKKQVFISKIIKNR